MAENQSGFSFDAPLVEMPVSQLPPRPPAPANVASMKHVELVAHLFAISEAIEENDIAYTKVLDLAGFPLWTQTGWHRSRMLEAIMPPNGNWQAYFVEPRNHGSELRFRRLPPMCPCCGEFCKDSPHPTLTRNVVCERCADAETEELFNTD